MTAEMPDYPSSLPVSPVERLQPTMDSEVTWLLNRAAQHMRGVISQEVESFGLQLRDQVVLTALALTPGRTQVELARALGLDKSTLANQIDRLDDMGLVTRRSDAGDRRRRVPDITPAGEDARAKAAEACARVESAAMAIYDDDQVRLFRQMLVTIIGEGDDRGSCL